MDLVDVADVEESLDAHGARYVDTVLGPSEVATNAMTTPVPSRNSKIRGDVSWISAPRASAASTQMARVMAVRRSVRWAAKARSSRQRRNA